MSERSETNVEIGRVVSVPDARLEEISDKIRKGEAVGIGEALEAIAYQEHIRSLQKLTFWQKLKRWLAH